MASKATVYIAFDCGNLNPVTATAKKNHPDSKVIVCADNDRFTNGNPGVSKGQEAAYNNSVHFTYPIFGDEDTKSSDFNDLHKLFGIGFIQQHLGVDAFQTPLYKEKKNADDQRQIPRYLLTPPGALGIIANHYNISARKPQPMFAVQTALAICSVMLGRMFKTKKNNYSTLYFLNIAKSGTGKEHVRTVINEVLEACESGDLIAGSGYTSAGAVFSTLLSKPSHISVIDEFGKYMEASKANANINAKEANRVLMEAIGSCHGFLRPANYSTMAMNSATKKETEERKVINPAPVIVGMTTPSTFFDNISKEQISDGFLGRFIVITSDAKRTQTPEPEIHSVPEAIITWNKTIQSRYKDRGNLLDSNINNSQIKPDEIVLGFDDAALSEISAFDCEMNKLMDELDPEGIEALCGRTKEFAMRIALIVALSKNPNAEIITKEDIVWGIEYMRFSVNQVVKSVRENMFSSEHEKCRAEILVAIQKRKNKGVSDSEMGRKAPFRGHKGRNLSVFLIELEKAKLIDKRDLKPYRSAAKKGPAVMGWVATDPA